MISITISFCLDNMTLETFEADRVRCDLILGIGIRFAG